MSYKILVMSVGDAAENATCKKLAKIGAKDISCVVLPKASEQHRESYEKKGFEVYIYDETTYINEEFEFYGFTPRNCGGVGRQGVAEAIENLGDEETIFWVLDDDISSIDARTRAGGKNFNCHPVNSKKKSVNSKKKLAALLDAFAEFWNETGVRPAAHVEASPISTPHEVYSFKIFDNFLMKKHEKNNFDGFKALCSDDSRWALYEALDGGPVLSFLAFQVGFKQSQGDRTDGNAPLYNKDFSWKKSWCAKMCAPWVYDQKIKKEKNRVLFREVFNVGRIRPRILLKQNNRGANKITGELTK